MSTRVWAVARIAGGAAILALLIWRLGTGPILDGLRSINAWSLAAAAGIAVVTTVCAAWRWRIVAHGLDIGLPLSTATAAYYRSQFLNTALPGGVLGDAHRAVRHGRDAGDVGRGIRAVVWERGAGQVVQIVLALLVLAILASPVRSDMPVVIPIVVAVALALLVLARALPRDGATRWTRAVRAARTDVHDGLLARDAWPGVVLASVIVVVGHTATFLLAARTAGTDVSLVTLLPLAMLVMLAMSVPTNIGGWGPREGVAAWSFGAAGLGAAQGVATATVYGVMVVVATLPGAIVLLVSWLRRRRRPAESQHDAPPPRVTEGALRG